MTYHFRKWIMHRSFFNFAFSFLIKWWLGFILFESSEIATWRFGFIAWFWSIASNRSTCEIHFIFLIESFVLLNKFKNSAFTFYLFNILSFLLKGMVYSLRYTFWKLHGISFPKRYILKFHFFLTYIQVILTKLDCSLFFRWCQRLLPAFSRKRL